MQITESGKNIGRLSDVEMNVTVRFGLTQVPLRDVVRFNVGSIIELNRTVDEPVELLINNSPFAHGEVVVIDGYYGIRIKEIGSPEELSEKLRVRTEPEVQPSSLRTNPELEGRLESMRVTPDVGGTSEVYK